MILASASVGFIFGVWVGAGLALSPLIAVCFGAVAAALGLSGRRIIAVACCAFCLGLLRAPHPGALSSHDLAYFRGQSLDVVGVVALEPDVRDTGINYVISVRQRQTTVGPVPLSGSLSIHVPTSVHYDYGDTLSVTGRLLPPGFAAGHPAGSMMFPRVSLQAGAHDTWHSYIYSLRSQISSGIDSWLPEPFASLLVAITLGSRSSALGSLAPVLVATGLIHIIAISGIKVAMVAGTVYAVFRRSGLRLLTLVAALVTLAMYVAITGATPSGERSALMWALVFVAAHLGRRTVAIVSLVYVAALMLALDPTLINDLGFQMSTVGTLAIVAFSDRISRWFKLIPTPWRESLSVTIAAQLGTLPIVAMGFHTLSVVGPIANAVVLPFLPVLIALGFILGAACHVALIAAPAAALAYSALRIVIQVSSHLASLPGAAHPAAFGSWFAPVYFSLLGLGAVALLRRSNWNPGRELSNRGRELWFALALGLASLSVTEVQAGGDATTSLTWLGAGDGILLQTPSERVLIGGAARPALLLSELGTALPYPARSLSTWILGDPRSAVAAGVTGVMRHYDVGSVLDAGMQYPSLGYAEALADLHARRVPTFSLHAGVRVQVGNSVVQAVGPFGVRSDPGNSVGILRIEVRGRSFLLVGRAGTEEQHEAVFRDVSLASDVLLVGGTQNLDPSFLAATGAKSVVRYQFDAHSAAGAKLTQAHPLILYSASKT